MDQLIKTELPRQTDKGKVTQFLDTRKINHRQINDGNNSISPEEAFEIKVNRKEVEFLITADTPCVRKTSMCCEKITIDFYFDKQEKLLGHRVYGFTAK